MIWCLEGAERPNIVNMCLKTYWAAYIDITFVASNTCSLVFETCSQVPLNKLTVGSFSTTSTLRPSLTRAFIFSQYATDHPTTPPPTITTSALSGGRPGVNSIGLQSLPGIAAAALSRNARIWASRSAMSYIWDRWEYVLSAEASFIIAYIFLKPYCVCNFIR